ncbi:division plane positioning ATPase MipZ [Alteriqipengyuania lutimaris]|uniref:division plane positioning ATPase MipZ n=1 Tax=Alteriqipengyuania lutimaris TaxID=1538146 RepID=UPI0017C53FF3|nr:division plane positioning ATPase MipZ [Alteriqipengyuania lutimaris]MBB3032601.1 chromosome partitioning protein [Alteriqipengyuania lutimaris]
MTGINPDIRQGARPTFNPHAFEEEVPRNIVADIASRPPLRPHVITFANEKGGVGKSTLAFHVTVALAHAGHKVVAIDLDRRQRTLERGLTYRGGTAGNLGIALPCPQYAVLDHPSTASLYQTINRLGGDADFVILDAAGADSPIFRRVVAMADTLVTPINASFLDLELLGHLNPVSGIPESAGCFGQSVLALREEKFSRGLGRIEWVVVKNRVRTAEKRHLHRVDDALQRLSISHDFRIASGLSERVAFRELFQFGLTHLDLEMIPGMVRPQSSSRDEITALIADLSLQAEARGSGNGSTRPSARVLKRTREDYRAALHAAL